MSHGLTVLNNSNFVQIDESFSNYRVIAEGTVGSSGGFVYFPNYGVIPIVMVQPLVVGQSLYAGSITSSFFGVGPLGVSYKYKVLVPSNVVAHSGQSHGLRVYNGSNQLVFDSGNTGMLRLKQLLNIPGPFANQTFYTSLPYSAGGNYMLLNSANLSYTFTHGGRFYPMQVEFNLVNSVDYALRYYFTDTRAPFATSNSVQINSPQSMHFFGSFL